VPRHVLSVVKVKGILVLMLSFVLVGSGRFDRFVDLSPRGVVINSVDDTVVREG
jgi:hypothetical protein